MPSHNIGPMLPQDKQADDKDTVQNFEINFTQTKDGVTTEVLEDGEPKYFEQTNTGG